MRLVRTDMTGNFERKVLGGLGLASVLIAGVTIVYHYSSERLVESAGRVSETHALMAGLSDFEGRMQTAKMAARGYAVTGDSGIRELFAWSRDQTLASLAKLNSAGTGDVHQRGVVAEIDKVAREQLRSGDELVDLRQKQGSTPPADILATWYRDDVKDPLRRAVSRLANDTRAQLSERQALARDCGISGETARQELAALSRFGYLRRVGRGRATEYVLR